MFVEPESDIREFRQLACDRCDDDIKQLTDPTMKWLILDEYVETVEQMIGRDIWNRMCHVRQSSQWRGLVVIKYFSMYVQCFRICEDSSNFPKE